MGEQREIPVADTPVDRARRAVANAWKTAGWPDPPRSAAAYATVRERLVEYLALAFPLFDESQRRESATESLEKFMAALYADLPSRRPTWSDQSRPFSQPDDLAAAARDAALDRVRGPSTDSPGATGHRPNEKDDRWLAELAVGAMPTAVRAGLAMLAADDERIDFLIITQYLDLADRDRTRPPPSAEIIAHLADRAISEAMVRRAILSFRHRISRIDRHDAHG